MKKYEFTGKTINAMGTELKQIKRLSDGLIGGWIEKENNLSHEGKCFVYENALVYGNARVSGDAVVAENAVVAGNARIYGNAKICGNNNITTAAIQIPFEKVETYKNGNSRTITALLTDNGWRFNVGCQELITKEEFIDKIHKTNGGLEKNPYREFYLKILNLF